MSGRCGQRRPGQRHIACVTCQDIPGSPSLSVLAQRVEPGNEATILARYNKSSYTALASFPVLPRTRFTFTCGGEHFETGKAWSETSREVDVYIV